jgi:hypothetical protein
MIEEDKRQFTRYSKESLCDVILGSEIYKGKIIDYSDGVGVIIKKIPELVKGALADIRILDCEIEFGAEVAWIEEMGYHLRVGFKRLDNLKGNLKHYRLVDILLGLSKSRKTGILNITVGSTVKKIYVDNGIKIFAASTNTNDRLGEYLLTQGNITLEEYNQASYLVEKRGQRLGQVLIDLGYLKPSDLAPSIHHQVEEIIISLFNIDEGKFEFKEEPLSTDEPIKLNLSTANLIYKGIKRINSFPMVDKMCPPLDTVFNLSKDPLPLFQSLTLEYTDKKILSTVNGINTLKTILSLSHSRNFETLKTIISLLTIGLITIKGANEDPVKPPLEVIFGEPDEALAKEQHKEEADAVGAVTAEDTSEYKSNVEINDEMIELSKTQETVTEEHDEVSVEITTEEIHEEQPIADKVRYIKETSGVPEPIAMHTDLAAATNEEEYVQVNDKTSDKITEEVVLNVVQPTSDNAYATENVQSKKKWVISVVIIIVIIGAIVPLVYKNIKTPLSSPAATTVNKNESVSSMHDKKLHIADTEISKDKISYPNFREDAINKLLNE